MGGLRTSVDGEVLTADGDGVPGLYAAGRTTSGIAAQGYSSGLSLADATFFGRRAGLRGGEGRVRRERGAAAPLLPESTAASRSAFRRGSARVRWARP